MSELTISEHKLPSTFDEVSSLITELVPDRGGEDEDQPMIWDGTISDLELVPEVSIETGLEDKVRCRVIGDSEGGIALILRSRNPFNTKRFGFYVQPRINDEGMPISYEVWQAPAIKPKRGKVYWGIELLEREQARLASPETSLGLIRSLHTAASNKDAQ